jgi:seryl-tRNA synthetase
MLQVPYLRDNTEKALTGLAKRNKDFSVTVQSIISVDESRRKLQNELDNLLAESNKISKTIGDLFKEGKREEADGMKVRTTEIKEECKGIETNLSQLEEELKQLLYQVPNVPHESVLFGKGAEENEVVYSSGEVTSLGESKLPHWELCEKHKLIDFELGVKITGAGFPVYIGKGARLQRALINFFLGHSQSIFHLHHVCF